MLYWLAGPRQPVQDQPAVADPNRGLPIVLLVPVLGGARQPKDTLISTTRRDSFTTEQLLHRLVVPQLTAPRRLEEEQVLLLNLVLAHLHRLLEVVPRLLQLLLVGTRLGVQLLQLTALRDLRGRKHKVWPKFFEELHTTRT